jgi:hypothetical protein
MDPRKVAAQFAAYDWFTNQWANRRKPHQEAARFAREAWVAFLPRAHEGLGRFLIKLAGDHPSPRAPARPVRA